ncbi:MAG: hypothetical protein U0903_07450 [Planctomycetales bacterium]
MKMISWSTGLALLAMVFASGCCCPGRCYNSCYDPCGSLGTCAPSCAPAFNSCGGGGTCGGCDMCGSSTAWDDSCDWTMDCIDGTCSSVGNQCGKLKCRIKSGCKSFWAALNHPCSCDQCSNDDSYDWLTQPGCDCSRCKKQKKCKGGCEYTDGISPEPMSPPKCQSCQAGHKRKYDDPTGYAHIGPGSEEIEQYAMDGSIVPPFVQGPMPGYEMYAQGLAYPPGQEYFQGPAAPMMMAPPPQVAEQEAPAEGQPPALVQQPLPPAHYPPSSAYPRSVTRWRPAENVPAPPVEEDSQLVPSNPIPGPAVTQPVQGEEEDEFERPLILRQSYEGAPGFGIVPAGQ